MFQLPPAYDPLTCIWLPFHDAVPAKPPPPPKYV